MGASSVVQVSTTAPTCRMHRREHGHLMQGSMAHNQVLLPVAERGYPFDRDGNGMGPYLYYWSDSDDKEELYQRLVYRIMNNQIRPSPEYASGSVPYAIIVAHLTKFKDWGLTHVLWRGPFLIPYVGADLEVPPRAKKSTFGGVGYVGIITA